MRRLRRAPNLTQLAPPTRAADLTPMIPLTQAMNTSRAMARMGRSSIAGEFWANLTKVVYRHGIQAWCVKDRVKCDWSE